MSNFEIRDPSHSPYITLLVIECGRVQLNSRKLGLVSARKVGVDALAAEAHHHKATSTRPWRSRAERFLVYCALQPVIITVLTHANENFCVSVSYRLT